MREPRLCLAFYYSFHKMKPAAIFIVDCAGGWIMKAFFLIAVLLLAVSILAAGCTNQNPQPAPPATTAPVTTVPIPPVQPRVPTLSGQGWNLGWYDDTKGLWSSVIQGNNITAWFGADGNISGQVGCSYNYSTYYSTGYQTAGNGSIYIRRPDVNVTTCQAPTGVLEQNSEYFTDLGWANSYTITNNQLLLFDMSGKKILQFDPLP
jgi:hypothetical protein